MTNDRFKFRAWNRVLKYFAEDLDIRVDLDGSLWTGSSRYTADNFDLTQSTGLKDKNGVLIFEGDVLGHNNADSVYVVEWRQGCCGFVAQIPEGNRFDHFIHCGEWQYMEIIGNIHENPELLK
jgi:uncharacterized phage protein (TIGR01671 family)